MSTSLSLRDLTPEALAFSNGQTLRWADVQQVTWLGDSEQWLLRTQTRQWLFKRPSGWLGIQMDAAIYALPHSQAFWGSTPTARIPAEISVWNGKAPQLDPQKERQMRLAQLADWVLIALGWVGFLIGSWLLIHDKGLGLFLIVAPFVFQLFRYRLEGALLKVEERHISGLSVQSDTVTLHYSIGESETLDLDQLQAVRILTTDNGPFGNDLYFILEGEWGKRFISGELDDCQHLFGLFDCLPNFDHQQSVQAMGSTENAVFEVWNAPEQEVAT